MDVLMANVLIEILVLFIVVIISMFIGTILGIKKWERKKFHAGNIVVDLSDPLKDVLNMELECSITEMLAQDELYFKVIIKGSQEKPLA